MNCERVHDLLSEAIDGTLSPADAARFDAHLGACPPCRLLFGEMKEALALLAEDPKIEPSPDFDRQVWRRIREERAVSNDGVVRRMLQRVEAWQGGWMRLAPLAAAATVLAWVAVSSDPFTAEAGDPVAFVDPVSDLVVDEMVVPPGLETNGSDLAAREYEAGMPQAIEEWLDAEANSSRSLELNPDRYRRSNYHYPLRAVRDPLSAPVIPVSEMTRAGTRSIPPGASRSPEASGVPVLSF